MESNYKSKNIIKQLKETIDHINKHRYDHQVDKDKFILMQQNIRNAEGKEVWTKDIAQNLGKLLLSRICILKI